ncbi:MAG: thioredoxin [Clostridia bacterium]|nr:thioredoxin [Clostridia bacterium]
MVTKIENEKMEKALEAKAAVVDFSATWCGPCRMLAPVMEELSEEMEGKVDFYNADTDENPQLAGKYNIYSIPAVLVFKEGQLVGSAVGFRPKADMKAFIESKIG